MTLSLADIAASIGAPPPALPAEIARWSTDSRSIEPGALFFALKGPNFDGNRFLPEVFAKGAAAAVAESPYSGGTVLVVPDTLNALKAVSRRARERWKGAVVAVTGSAGKTTTKDLIAHLLSTRKRVGKNAGNLNNHIGLPLSILKLPDEIDIAVLEIGMNHAGEIRDLAAIARPSIGVVTNVGSAHVEFFDDGIEGIARAKRELVESLGPDGVAVLNADDERVIRFREVHPGRTVTFGLSASADVRAEDVEQTGGGVRFRCMGSILESSLSGCHGVRNLLAGLAVAGEFGIRPRELRDAVRSFALEKMRGAKLIHRGITVLDDCYNSNPEAARAMIDTLAATPARQRIAVLGEMLELGPWAEALHRDVGRYAAGHSVSVLVGIRGAARFMVDEAMKSGMSHSAAYFFDDPADAGSLVREVAREGDAVLFKGSRGTKVEKALERFLE